MVSQNLCQKSVSLFLYIITTPQCRYINKTFSLTVKIFREINFFLTSSVKPLLSRNFCQKCVRLKFSFFHTVVSILHSVEKWKIYSHWKNISSNQLFSDFVSKNVIFTEFLPKKCESKFLQSPQCVALNCDLFFLFENINQSC